MKSDAERTRLLDILAGRRILAREIMLLDDKEREVVPGYAGYSLQAGKTYMLCLQEPVLAVSVGDGEAKSVTQADPNTVLKRETATGGGGRPAKYRVLKLSTAARDAGPIAWLMPPSTNAEIITCKVTLPEDQDYFVEIPVIVRRPFSVGGIVVVAATAVLAVFLESLGDYVSEHVGEGTLQDFLSGALVAAAGVSGLGFVGSLVYALFAVFRSDLYRRYQAARRLHEKAKQRWPSLSAPANADA